MTKKSRKTSQNRERKRAQRKVRDKGYGGRPEPARGASLAAAPRSTPALVTPTAEQAAEMLGFPLPRVKELEGLLSGHPALLRVSEIFDQFPRVADFARRRDGLEAEARRHEIRQIHTGWQVPSSLARRARTLLDTGEEATTEVLAYLSLCANPVAILGQEGWKQLHEAGPDGVRLERAWSYLLEEPDEALALVGPLLELALPEALDLAAHAHLYLDEPGPARARAEACLATGHDEGARRCRTLLAWLDGAQGPAAPSPASPDAPLAARLAHFLERLREAEKNPPGAGWTRDLVALAGELAEALETPCGLREGGGVLHPFLWDELMSRLRAGALAWPNSAGLCDPVAALPWALRYRLDRAACLAEMMAARPEQRAGVLLCALVQRRRSVCRAGVSAAALLAQAALAEAEKMALREALHGWLRLSDDQPLADGLALF